MYRPFHVFGNRVFALHRWLVVGRSLRLFGNVAHVRLAVRVGLFYSKGLAKVCWSYRLRRYMSLLCGACRQFPRGKWVIAFASWRKRSCRAIPLIGRDRFGSLLELFLRRQALFGCGVVPVGAELNYRCLLAMDCKAALAARQSLALGIVARECDCRRRISALVAAAVRRAATGLSKSAL